MCSGCAFDSGRDYLSEVDAAKQAAAAWRKNYQLLRTRWRDLNAELENTKAELSDVRSDLADTTETLDKYREMLVKMTKANSTLTEERDLARELFRGMMNEYADLLDRHSKTCDAPWS